MLALGDNVSRSFTQTYVKRKINHAGANNKLHKFLVASTGLFLNSQYDVLPLQASFLAYTRFVCQYRPCFECSIHVAV